LLQLSVLLFLHDICRRLAGMQHWLHEVVQLLQHSLQLQLFHCICLGDHKCGGYLKGHSHSQVLPSDACDARGSIHTQQRVVCDTQSAHEQHKTHE
jgi:hypothetical protein